MGHDEVKHMLQMLTLKSGQTRNTEAILQVFPLSGIMLNRICFLPSQKEGRFWRVREDAELVGTLTTPVVKKSDPVLLQRILNDGCQTT